MLQEILPFLSSSGTRAATKGEGGQKVSALWGMPETPEDRAWCCCCGRVAGLQEGPATAGTPGDLQAGALGCTHTHGHQLQHVCFPGLLCWWHFAFTWLFILQAFHNQLWISSLITHLGFQHLSAWPAGCTAGRWQPWEQCKDGPQPTEWDAVPKLFDFRYHNSDKADLKSSILILPPQKNLLLSSAPLSFLKTARTARSHSHVSPPWSSVEVQSRCLGWNFLTKWTNAIYEIDKTTHEAFKWEQFNLLLWNKLPLACPCCLEANRQLWAELTQPRVQRLFCFIRATVAVGTVLIELQILNSLRKTGCLKQSLSLYWNYF